MIQTHAPASQRGYEHDLITICEWMGSRPINEVSVLDFLTAMESQRAPNTLRRYLAAITYEFFNRDPAEPSPSYHPDVINRMREIQASSYYRVRHAKPLTPELIEGCIDALPESLTGIRDRAILTVGYRAAPIERAALASLEVENVRGRKGWKTWSVEVTRGRYAPLKIERPTNNTYDLWDAVRRWRKVAQIDAGPLFLGGDRHGGFRTDAISGQSVSLLLQAALVRIGENPSGYSANSLKTLAPT